MNKRQTEEALRRTQEILQKFYQKDLGPVFSYCSIDVTWIGSRRDQFEIGMRAFRDSVERYSRQITAAHMTNQEFLIAQNSGKTCTVIGRYQMLSDENEEEIAIGSRRCVMVWELINNLLKVKHLCISSPLDEWESCDRENRDAMLGAAAKEYAERRAGRMSSDVRIVFTDKDGVVHFLHPNEVLYFMADRKHTIVHTLDGDLSARDNLAVFRQSVGESRPFLQIHRGYIINVNFISQIRPYQVIMQDDSLVPIPLKRYTETKRRIRDMFE